MLIDEITALCHAEYSSSPGAGACADCVNSCAGNCELCLDNIHFGRDSRKYNCCNIANYYVCKYSFKYATEIETLLHACPGASALSTFKVLSIGCGPCTDLFAFEAFNRRSGRTPTISYLGVDYNRVWAPVHAKVAAAASKAGIKTKFVYHDIFQLVDKVNHSEGNSLPNVLCLQYVLSDMADHQSEEDILGFIDNAVRRLVSPMPDGSLIILNDINLNEKTRSGSTYKTARRYYQILLDRVYQSHTSSLHWSYHFANSARRTHYHYGEEHKDNMIVYDVPTPILKKYNPWTSCSSAQLVIRKGA